MDSEHYTDEDMRELEQHLYAQLHHDYNEQQTYDNEQQFNNDQGRNYEQQISSDPYVSQNANQDFNLNTYSVGRGRNVRGRGARSQRNRNTANNINNRVFRSNVRGNNFRNYSDQRSLNDAISRRQRTRYWFNDNQQENAGNENTMGNSHALINCNNASNHMSKRARRSQNRQLRNEGRRVDRNEKRRQRVIRYKLDNNYNPATNSDNATNAQVVSINVDASNESETDDVIILPPESPQIVLVDDSDDNMNESTDNIGETGNNEVEKNAEASKSTTDTVYTFAKPFVMPSDASDNRARDTSRCTSPASVISDDFIGTQDRQRLRDPNKMSQFEHDGLLTSDMDSLLEVPTTSKESILLQPAASSGKHTLRGRGTGNVTNKSDLPSTSSSVAIANEATSSDDSDIVEYRHSALLARRMNTSSSEDSDGSPLCKLGIFSTKRQKLAKPKQSQTTASKELSLTTKLFANPFNKPANTSAPKSRQAKVPAAANDTALSARSSGDNNESTNTANAKTKATAAPTSEDTNAAAAPTPTTSDADRPLTSTPDPKASETPEWIYSSFNTCVPNIKRGPALKPDLFKYDRLRRLEYGLPLDGDNDPYIAFLERAKPENWDKMIAAIKLAEKSNYTEESDEANNDQTILLNDSSDDDDNPILTVLSTAAPNTTSSKTKNAKRSKRDETTKNSEIDEEAIPDYAFEAANKSLQLVDSPTFEGKAGDGSINADDEEVNEVITVSASRVFTSPLSGVGPTMFVYHNYLEEQRLVQLPWKEEMRRFYDCSWKGENFSLREVQSKMNSDRNLWKILPQDRYPQPKRLQTQRCLNCGERGHVKTNCAQPRRVAICHMCSRHGHEEGTCPKSVCLNCGERSRRYMRSCQKCASFRKTVCPLCHCRGHTIESCPDLWRRYHSTIEPNKIPNSNLVYNKRSCCCSCGRVGHLCDDCPNIDHRQTYTSTTSRIISHRGVYDDVQLCNSNPKSGMHLLYDPNVKYKLNLASDATPQKYYGRFLNAVGLGHLMNHKRKSKNLAVPEQLPFKRPRIDGNENENDKDKDKNKVRTSRSPKNSTSVDNSNKNDRRTLDLTEQDYIAFSKNDDSDFNQIEDSRVTKRNTPVSFYDETTKETLVLNVLAMQKGKFKPPQQTVINTAAIAKMQKDVHNQQQQQQPKASPLLNDSDSNYSFSEHFDLPVSSAQSQSALGQQMEKEQEEANQVPVSEPHQVDSKQDTIPDNTKESKVTIEIDNEPQCNAKILLLPEYTRYLCTADGSRFLIDLTQKHNLKVNIKYNSIGHHLNIDGTRTNQMHFQRELLGYLQNLNQNAEVDVQIDPLSHAYSLPKRVIILKRHLRTYIENLYNYIGNPKELMQRLRLCERSTDPSKNSRRSIERVRRSLNMIFMGQAGLANGDRHAKFLINYLKSIAETNNRRQMLSNELRNVICNRFGIIFGSNSNDYDKLLKEYNRLASKCTGDKFFICDTLIGMKPLFEKVSNQIRKSVKENKESTENTEESKESQIAQPVHIHFDDDFPITEENENSQESQRPQCKVEAIDNSDNNENDTDEYDANAGPSREPTICELLDSVIKHKGAPLSGIPKYGISFWTNEAIKTVKECVHIVMKSKMSDRQEILDRLKRVQNKTYQHRISYEDFIAIAKVRRILWDKN